MLNPNPSAYDRKLYYSPRSVINETIKSTYDYPHNQIGMIDNRDWNNKAKTPSLVNDYSTSTSLFVDNNENIRRIQERVLHNNQVNDRNKTILLNYYNNCKTPYNPDHYTVKLKNNPIQPYPILMTKDIEIPIKPREPTKQLILPDRRKYAYQPNKYEEDHILKREKYFVHKVVNEQDYGNHNYIDYLRGRIKNCQPNPYNPHIDYLGHSDLPQNTILNPIANYKHNRYLFQNTGSHLINK